MTKAFVVRFKDTEYIQFNGFISSAPISWGSQGGYNSSSIKKPKGPILMIAKNIADVAARYPNAIDIQEFEVDDVVISEKIDYLLNKGG